MYAIRSYYAGSLGLKDAPRTLALAFSYPEDVAVLPNDLLLFVFVGPAECLVDENYRPLDISNIDTILCAHYGSGKQFDFLLHHFA